MTTDRSIGYVLGTQEATPLEFWVAVGSGKVLRLDDVVQVQTLKPDGETIHFYGIVDYVRTLYEGAEFDTDTFLAKEGKLPVNISYAAHVQVTRLEPEEYLPPQPGDPVQLAIEEELKRALHFDNMDSRLPAGLMRNGDPAYLNFSFLNGEKGAHVNISGISGVATKTSYALFLLHAIFNSAALGKYRANTRALIFNVKGEDLFFLDRENIQHQQQVAKLGYDPYDSLGLPAIPFQQANFRVVPKKSSPEEVIPHLDQRSDNIAVYMWSIREVCRDRLLQFLFVGEDLSRGNLVYLLANVEERLAKIAEKNDAADRQANREPQPYLDVEFYGEFSKTRISTFGELIEFLDDKLIGIVDADGDDIKPADQRWLARNQPGTALALIRRLMGVRNEISHLIRGNLPAEQLAKYQLDPLAAQHQLTVADINRLGGKAQMFVVGVTLRKLFLEKEKRGQFPIVFIVLDELNKYAPREGRSPIKDLLVEIAERGRSLGIILIGAQQTASEVERRVVGQAAIRVVGRLDSAEAERSEYNFLTGSCRKRALFLKSGAMFVQQPEVPAPILVNFPFPAYATRQAEVALPEAEVAAIEADIDRF